ncbi:MAG: hypothetical protein JW800_00055 [Candidatus Omnitrophica bacterium]|nr:hypothetical protein [Candidatus Omnitrophota bacterium]
MMKRIKLKCRLTWPGFIHFIVLPILPIAISLCYQPKAHALDNPATVEEVVKIEKEITKEKENALVEHFYSEGKRLLADGKYEEAVDQFSRILEIDPKHSGARRGIESIKKRLQEKKESESPQVLSMRLVRTGRFKYTDKDYDGAIEDFQDALVLDYKNKEALEWLKRTRRAKSLEEMSDEDRDLEREHEITTHKKELHEKTAMIEVENAYLPPRKPEDNIKEEEGDITFTEDEDERMKEILIQNLKKKMVPAISLVEADIRDVIRELMEITGTTIVIDEGALQEVTNEEPLRITLTTVTPLPLLDVLDIALKATALNYKVLPNYIWVSTPIKLKQEELITKTYKLRYGVRKVRKVGLKEFVTKSSSD